MRPLLRFFALLLTITLLLPYPVAMGWQTTRTSTYNEKENTHLWILHSAIELMKRSENDEISSIELDYITAWKKALERGIHHADWRCCLNTFFLYGTHYYDPDTGKSFIPTKTAKDVGVQYFEEAGTHYKHGKFRKAFYCLGLSLHYLTDLTQPMHAALFTDWNLSLPSYHDQFEKLAVKVQDQFILNEKIQFNNSQRSEDPAKWFHDVAVKSKQMQSALEREDIRKYYLHSFVSKRHKSRWIELVTPIIKEQLIEAQRLTAQFIHLWFKIYVLK